MQFFLSIKPVCSDFFHRVQSWQLRQTVQWVWLHCSVIVGLLSKSEGWSNNNKTRTV